MTTTLLPSGPPPGEHVLLDGVTWDFYEALLHENEETHVRISYDGGRLQLTSPLLKHEWFKKRVGRLIEMATLEWSIPVNSLGSTTWRRRDLLKGLEADECYYIQHEAQVRSRDDLDLSRDPPPDLAVEIDITYSPMSRQSIYAGLGVNEVWRYDGKGIQFLKLQPGGRYTPIERSEALPRLTPADIDRFLAMFGTLDETSIFKSFRDWVRAV
jgi:Uma2 family endonuclease